MIETNNITKAFKTQTNMVDRANPSSDTHWVVGLDIGYSAVKGMSPNKYFSFPAYAKRVDKDRAWVKENDDNDIQYRESENSDDKWYVGSIAYNEVNSNDIVDSETELFSRKRYESDMFLIIARVGLAFGLMPNLYGAVGNRKVAVQTGLPPKYIGDAPIVKSVLSGHHEFEIKIGNNSWTKFSFDLSGNDIYVMPQPLGALVSATVGMDGAQIADSQKIISSSLIVFDPGFGTTDEYILNKGQVISSETFANLGMKEVFSRTIRDIKNAIAKEGGSYDIQLPEFQNKLEGGFVRYNLIDRATRKPKRCNFDFTEILKTNAKNVCRETVMKLNSIHNYFQDIDIIIAAGGTYDAWAEDFTAEFEDMEDLSIIPGNVNDKSMPNIFSNVRGYYFFLTSKLK